MGNIRKEGLGGFHMWYIFCHGMSYCNGAMNAVTVSMCIEQTVKVQGRDD